jgi:NADPH:quinone reductase-like Zn-dependent oxidoreductase
MQAAVVRKFGDPDVLRLEEVPTPEVPLGHVLVKVLATGINRIEHYLRAGGVVSLAFPHVLGSDAAGVVETVGEGVTSWRAGDRVIPMPGYPLDASEAHIRPLALAPSYTIAGITSWGSYAQYMLVHERWLLLDDTGLAPELAATLPMTLLTAVRAVKVVGEVRDGQHVLIHAGGGGTGSMNLQVALALGARVATTVDDPKKAKMARDLGAELVIDVRSESFVDRVREWTRGAGADVVVDNLGGEVFPKSLEALRPGGTLVAMGFVAGDEVGFHVRNFFFTQKNIRGTLMGDVQDLEWGLDCVKRRLIIPTLDRALPLAKAAEAHRLISSNDVRGSLVLLPWAS